MRAHSLALLLAGLLILSGCTDSESGGEEGFDPDGAIDYVALGDSFTSAPFVDEVREDPPGCGRSTQNYPAFLADWLDVRTYKDVSCAGALTLHLGSNQGTLDGGQVPPQLDVVTPDTDLVTLGLGVNDDFVYSRIIACRAAEAECDAAALEESAHRLTLAITASVDAIGEKAPDAEVLVVGYPHILPSDAGCDVVTAPVERLAELEEVMVALNESLRGGAAEADASYVDLWGPSEGHDVCAGEEAWIVGDQHGAGVGAQFHPNILGTRAAAVAVYEALSEESAPDAERAELDPEVVVLNEPATPAS